MLTRLQNKIEEYYEQNHANWRKNSQNETLKYLKQGLIDRAVTRDLDWGVDVPIKGYENKKNVCLGRGSSRIYNSYNQIL